MVLPGKKGNAARFRALNGTIEDEESLSQRILKSDIGGFDQLTRVSQAHGQSLKDTDGYYYDDSAGDGIKTYIIDNGAEASRPVCRHSGWESLATGRRHSGIQTYYDRLATSRVFPDSEENDVDIPKSHDTCMISMAAGDKDEIAKEQ